MYQCRDGGAPTVEQLGRLPLIVHSQDRNYAAGASGVRGNVREMVELPN
jgi:hypothetical protein